MKKGLKVAVGAPAAAALAVTKKSASVVGNRLAVTKAGVAFSNLKNDTLRAVQDRYHTSKVGQMTQGKRERKGNRALAQLESRGYNLFDKDGNPKSEYEYLKMTDDAGISKTDRKQL